MDSGVCSYLPFLCSALAFEIHVLLSIDSESKASKAFCKHPSQSIIKYIKVVLQIAQIQHVGIKIW